MTRIGCIAILFLHSFFVTGQTDTVVKPQHIDSIHSPKKATMLSVIFPGLGQIYNDINRPEGKKAKTWWKLPLIYGGLGAAGYFAVQNHKTYRFFRNERLDLQNDPNSLVSTNGFSDSQLKSIYDQYSRWRDLSIVAGLGIYLLNIIDASVSGTLLHFDSSDDLSFNIQPKVFYLNQSTFTGMSLSLHFKDKNRRKVVINDF